MTTITQREKLTLLGAAIGCREVTPETRAQLFRETTTALVPEFAYLVKRDGDPNRIPHDCLENLDHEMNCTICGARYEEEQKGIHLVTPRLKS